MVEDAIKKFDPTEPKDTTFVDDAPTVLPENWDAMLEMMGSWMHGLGITCSAGKTMTIDYTRLGMELNTGTPPQIFVNRSPSTITIDWDNGEAMDGRETGLATTVGWKYIWAFRDDTNGVTSGLLSAATAIGSVVEPDTDFRFGRLIGAAYWDGASAFTAFIQRDRRVTLKSFATPLSAGRSDSPTWTSVSLSTYVPPIAKRISGWAWREQATGTAGARQLQIRIAADTSGNYQGTFLDTYFDGVAGQNWGRIFFRDHFEQELTSQAFSYLTEDIGPNIQATVNLSGYEIEI